ncbi:MAG: hypothetical protein JJT75_09210 [Opitutales bacterium]|nr:hypothetical protein [Opitutales bacterium]MCH8541730.1 hypothetical protein [Opitutales bacterium]
MKASTILQALQRLGELAQAEEIKLEISIYGGTAFLLAYNSREGTKDIDAILKPKGEGERLARQVARELGLPEDWINADVVQFISPKIEAKRRLAEIEEATGLIVHVPTAEYLLAMKAMACRRPIAGYRGDIDDLAFLIRKMKIRSLEQIQQVIDRFYPDDIIPKQDQTLLQSLIDESHA